MLAKQLFNLFLAISALHCLFGSAAGQQYRTDPADGNFRRYGAGSSAKQWLTNPAAYAADKVHFDEYFDKYYFPEMTKSEDVNLGHLGDGRFNLFKRYLWVASNPAFQHDLSDKAFNKMQEIVLAKNPPYHPAVRYNAILIIGMLDEQYSDGKRPPKPWPAANEFLVKVVNFAANDAPVPPPLVLGALIGLERHAQFHDQLDPKLLPPMSAALLKLVGREKPIQEMDREAYAWIRMRAASALARLGSVGEQNGAHNALIKLIASSKALDDRCEAAALLEKINYKDVKLDDASTAAPLFALARDVGTAEDKRAQDFQDQVSGVATGRPMPPRPAELGPGAGGGTLEPETYPRRQVLARLTGLRTALAKVKPSLSAETQKKVDALLKAIDDAKKAVANKDVVELKLAEAIRAMAVAIAKAVPPEKPAGEKPAGKPMAAEKPAAAEKPTPKAVTAEKPAITEKPAAPTPTTATPPATAAPTTK